MLMPLIGFLAFSGAVSITDFTEIESSQLSRNTAPISSATATSSNPSSRGPKSQAVGRIKTTAVIRTSDRAHEIQTSRPHTAQDNAGLNLQKTLASIEKGDTGTPVIATPTVPPFKTTAAIRTSDRAHEIKMSRPHTAQDNAGLNLQKTLASIEKGDTGTPVIATPTVPLETQKTYFVGNEPGAEPESAWMK